jgi:hypothetical protein
VIALAILYFLVTAIKTRFHAVLDLAWLWSIPYIGIALISLMIWILNQTDLNYIIRGLHSVGSAGLTALAVACAIWIFGKKAVDYTYLGDEITIDMIVDIDRQNIAETPDRRVQDGQVYNEYIHILPKILSFNAKIKEGLRYSAVEYEEILDDVFKSKKPFTFRAGTKVYENYVFTSFIPAENFEESLNFSAEIKKIDVGSILIQKVNIPKSSSSISGQKPNQKVIKKNTSSQAGNSSKSIQNKTTPKKIYGIGRFFNIDQGVEDMTKKLDSWKGKVQ